MSKYEDALDWLIYRCMEPNDDYGGLDYEQVPYFEIESNIEPLRELIEMATPTKLRKTKHTRICPSCNRKMSNLKNAHPNIKFCTKCGQALDWDEGEENASAEKGKRGNRCVKT